MTCLREVLRHVKRSEAVVDGAAYPALGVLKEGKGLLTKEPFVGGSTGYKSLNRVAKGDVVLRTITAFESPVGVAQEEHDGGFVSGVFETFEVTPASTPAFLRLYFTLPAFWEEMQLRAQGSVLRRKTISRELFLDIRISLPNLREQHRIVDLMGAVDAYVAAADARVEAARTARTAILTDLLSTPGEDWVETTLGAIGADGLFTDGDWVESKDQDPEGDVRLTQLADIGDGIWLDKSNRFLTVEKAHQLRCTVLQPDDILIARMPDPIGRACLFPGADRQCVTVVDVAVLRPAPDSGVLPQFLVNAINLSATRRHIEALQGGTTRTRVSRGNLATVGIAVPTVYEQHRIIELLAAADADIAKGMRVAAHSRVSRAAILADLLSGTHEIPASYDRFLEAA